MKDFKIKHGTYNLAGQDADVWLVIDGKALLHGSETVAGVVFRSESGNALVEAMLHAGAAKQDD